MDKLNEIKKELIEEYHNELKRHKRMLRKVSNHLTYLFIGFQVQYTYHRLKVSKALKRKARNLKNVKERIMSEGIHAIGYVAVMSMLLSALSSCVWNTKEVVHIDNTKPPLSLEAPSDPNIKDFEFLVVES